MNLSDFLTQPFEKDIVDKLESIHKDGVKYYLTLWYKDGYVEPSQIKKFILDYEKNLHLKTNIKVGGELKANDFVWFDLIKKSDSKYTSRVRFEYQYSDNKSIMDGLEEFHKCAKFCISEKPRKQKRNDYESGDSR